MNKITLIPILVIFVSLCVTSPELTKDSELAVGNQITATGEAKIGFGCTEMGCFFSPNAKEGDELPCNSCTAHVSINVTSPIKAIFF